MLIFKKNKVKMGNLPVNKKMSSKITKKQKILQHNKIIYFCKVKNLQIRS